MDGQGGVNQSGGAVASGTAHCRPVRGTTCSVGIGSIRKPDHELARGPLRDHLRGPFSHARVVSLQCLWLGYVWFGLRRSRVG